MEADVKTIHNLPIEILQMIFSYGSPYDFLSFRQVCTRWNEGIGSLPDSQQKIILKINGKKMYDRVNESMLSSECRTPFQGIRFKHLGIVGKKCKAPQSQRIVTFLPNVLSPLKRLEFHYSMSNHTNLFQIISGCLNLQHLEINCPTQHNKIKVETEPGNYGPILAQLQSVSLTAGAGSKIQRYLGVGDMNEGSPLVAIHSILPKLVEHCKSLKSFQIDNSELRIQYHTHPEFAEYEHMTISGALKQIIQNNWVTLTHLNVKVVGLTELQEIGQMLAEEIVPLGNIMNLETFGVRLGRSDSNNKDWDSNSFLENVRLFIETQKGLRKLCVPLIQDNVELMTLEKFYNTLGTQKYLSTLTIEAFFCEVNLNYLNLCGPSLKTLAINIYEVGLDELPSFTPLTSEAEAKIQGLEIRLKIVQKDYDRETEEALISALQLFPHLSHLTIDAFSMGEPTPFQTSISNHLFQEVIRNCEELKYLHVGNMHEVTDFGVTGIKDSFSTNFEARRHGLVRDYDVEPGRALGGVSLSNLRNLEVLHLGNALKLTDFGIRHGLQFAKLKRINIDRVKKMTDQGLMILGFQNPILTHVKINTSVPPYQHGLSSFGIDTFLRHLPHMFHQNVCIKGSEGPKLRGPLMYDNDKVRGQCLRHAPPLILHLFSQFTSSDSYTDSTDDNSGSYDDDDEVHTSNFDDDE